ncbi:MAG: hypothetical protein ONB46_17405 [candidate division KSB1 bacterium]|nr:hypothetical protein [candidate division KSB1 bacterium]MDZ7367618.1 hypothetical protein [candidate division KSB1 bacterium]MDZ7405410.1 hypothetical protein [candidate division KSB1 bacterium]
MNVKFLLILLFSAECLFAGAWTQHKDHYYFRLSGFSFSSRALFNQEGKQNDFASNGHFADLSVYAYLEYGISDLVTFVGSVPYKRLRFHSDATVNGERLDKKTSGWGDVYLGLRYLLSDQNAVTSLQAGFKLNSGYQTDTTALNLAPPLGDGQNDFELRALIGHSILRGAVYYNLDAGYRARSGQPVDEIPFALEAGLGLGKLGLVIGQIYGVRALSGARASAIKTESQTSLNRVEDYLKAHAQLILHAQKGVEVAFIYENIISGRNTAGGRSFGVALALKTRTQ